MAELLHRFSGNPFTTPVGQKIDQATDPSLTSENWALNIEICDLINETEDGARDAVRAIKRRLQQTAGKNFQVFLYTLTVLETCVKNCSKRFHILVTNKDFVQDLVKLIGPKNDPPPAVQEKVLSLIQSWAEAFHGQPDLQGVSIVYNELRNKGIEFPKSSVEPKVPIHTPHRSISSNPNNLSEVTTMDSPQSFSQSSPPQPIRPPTESYQIHLTPEQLNKLKSELEIVQGNMKVLSEMLTELKPGQEHKDDWDLLFELHSTCQSMQKRIVELIEKVANEEVTSELLRINDELNNLFMRFERYQKKRNNSNVPESDMIPSTSSKPQAVPLSSKSKVSNVPSLIDFTEDEPDALSQKLNKVNISEQSQLSPKKVQITENIGDQEFDMFAQLRSTSVPSTSNDTTSQDLLSLDSVIKPASSTKSQEPLKEKEMEEIEQWLENDKATNANANSSNMQFEQFLQRRSNVLEQQPLKKTSYNQDSSLI